MATSFEIEVGRGREHRAMIELLPGGARAKVRRLSDREIVLSTSTLHRTEAAAVKAAGRMLAQAEKAAT